MSLTIPKTWNFTEKSCDTQRCQTTRVCPVRYHQHLANSPVPMQVPAIGNPPNSRDQSINLRMKPHQSGRSENAVRLGKADRRAIQLLLYSNDKKTWSALRNEMTCIDHERADSVVKRYEVRQNVLKIPAPAARQQTGNICNRNKTWRIAVTWENDPGDHFTADPARQAGWQQADGGEARDRQWADVHSGHRLPMGGAAKGLAAAQHCERLFLPLDRGWHPRPASIRCPTTDAGKWLAETRWRFYDGHQFEQCSGGFANKGHDPGWSLRPLRIATLRHDDARLTPTAASGHKCPYSAASGTASERPISAISRTTSRISRQNASKFPFGRIRRSFM